MNDVTRSPIDYDSLNKGDVIPASRIAEITKTSPDSKKYPLQLLRLKNRIERELAERGHVWTLATINGDLKILTDAEASTYNYVESSHARRKERRCFVRQGSVDTSQLPSDQRREHDRRLEIQGRYIQAQASVRQQIRLKPAERNVPGLPQPATS